jgi:phosphatidylglycerophosphatase B
LLCLVWLLPSAFSACRIDSSWCTIAYWATESAGKIGTVIILALSCFFYTVRIESKRQKLKVFLKSFIVLGILLSGIAYINEHLTKEIIGIPRPSHLLIVKNSSIKIDSIYKVNEEKRKILLKSLILADTTTFKAMDVKVLDHWVEEAGYSFPSGHSFNAFLLAVILTYSLYHSRKAPIRKLYLLPFAWAVLVAVSRVAIGAHSALDVSFGASLGLIVGHLFLYIDHTRALITERE